MRVPLKSSRASQRVRGVKFNRRRVRRTPGRVGGGYVLAEAKAGTGPYMVNVAETCVGTKALGPGVRSVVWVQGCPLHCHGCIAPDWIPQRQARLVHPDDLAAELLADENVSGLTLSGGEPMLQAIPLTAMVRAARRQRDMNVI